MPSERDLTDYTNTRGLVETTDKEVERPLFRKPGLDGEIASFQEIEERLSAFVRKRREESGLTRAEFASLYGLSTAVYGRYERAFSHLTVGRMIHLCELLGFTPLELIYTAAPHLYGATREEAEDRLKLAQLVDEVPHSTVKAIIILVEEMKMMLNAGTGSPGATR
jgi:transcriptional regulator with XRE-family HTH domain